MRNLLVVALAALAASPALAQAPANPVRGSINFSTMSSFQANQQSGPFTFPIAFQTPNGSGVNFVSATSDFARYVGLVANNVGTPGAMNVAAEIGVKANPNVCTAGGSFPCPVFLDSVAYSSAGTFSTYVFVTAPHSLFQLLDNGMGQPAVTFTGRVSIQQTGRDVTGGGYSCTVTGVYLPTVKPYYNPAVSGPATCIISSDFQ